MDLSIIIVNYHSRDQLASCLDSLFRNPPSLNFEVIVVDNDSGDDLSDLTKLYPGTKFLYSSRNLGMGGGNNLGISQAFGTYILVLNPDTIINALAIEIMVEYLSRHLTVGLVGPKLLYPDHSLQMSCARFPGFFMPLLRRTFLGRLFPKQRDWFLMNNFDHQSIQAVDWLMGSCLLFKKEIKLPSGEIFRPRFDERYFMYFEDIDLAREMKAHGLQVVYNSQASIIHNHQRQSARYPWYLAIFLDPLAREHIVSWIKYFKKWKFKK